MKKQELESLGVELCRSLLKKDYEGIALRFGYAISFEMENKDAIKRDFEKSVKASGGFLEHSTFSVTVKSFPSGTPGFINLVECRFSFENSEKQVLAEIIYNESGCYLEQISCET